MNASDRATTCLMLLKQDKTIIPVSTAAFEVAQDSQRNLNEYYRGALVVTRDGIASEIEQIEVVGIWGQSFIRNAISALTGVKKIHVRFREGIPLGLDEFKRLVIEYLNTGNETQETYLPQEQPLDFVLRRVESADNFSDVFDAINVPPPEDSLDGL